jgi:serine protease Do
VAQGPARELPITIAETPAETTAKAEQRKSAPQKPRQANSLGLTVSDIPAEQMKSLKLKNGVQIDGVDGPAARAGLQRGDIVLRVGDTDITSAKQFADVTAQLDPQKAVAVLVRRGDNTQFVPVRPRPSQKQVARRCSRFTAAAGVTCATTCATRWRRWRPS